MTYATGTSGLLDAEPASLRFGMFRQCTQSTAKLSHEGQ